VGLAGFVSGVVVAALPVAFRTIQACEFLITGDASFPCSNRVCGSVHSHPSCLWLWSAWRLIRSQPHLGSALGYLVGVGESNLMGVGSPATYALAGMGAFFSVVSKVPITAIVIVLR